MYSKIKFLRLVITNIFFTISAHPDTPHNGNHVNSQ